MVDYVSTFFDKVFEILFYVRAITVVHAKFSRIRFSIWIPRQILACCLTYNTTYSQCNWTLT